MNLLEKEHASDAGRSLLINAPIALALNTMSNRFKRVPKYGAYTSHIASHSTDPSVKPAD